MAFSPTTWVDGSAPAITAAQMNRIETGIDDAHAGNIDAGAIGALELADGAVFTQKIQDAAVTAVKIGSNAVTTPKLAAFAVDTPQLADAAVTPAKTSFVLGGNIVAMYAGAFNGSTGGVIPSGTPSLPTGWSVSRTTTGQYVITHNLGTYNLAVVATAQSNFAINVAASSPSVNTIGVRCFLDTGVAQDSAVAFVVMRY